MGILSWLRARFPTARDEMVRWMRDDYGRRFDEDCAAQPAGPPPSGECAQSSVGGAPLDAVDRLWATWPRVVGIPEPPYSREAAERLFRFVNAIQAAKLDANSIKTFDLPKTESSITTFDLPKTESPIKTVDLEAARAGSHAASQIAKANDDMVDVLWVLADRNGGTLRIKARDIATAKGGVIRFSVDPETGDTVIIRTSW